MALYSASAWTVVGGVAGFLVYQRRDAPQQFAIMWQGHGRTRPLVAERYGTLAELQMILATHRRHNQYDLTDGYTADEAEALMVELDRIESAPS